MPWFMIALAYPATPVAWPADDRDLLDVGDFDGDGFDDLLVHGDRTLEIFRGSATGIDRLVPAWALPTANTAGIEVAIGDVDGDGHADLLVGAGVVADQVQLFLGSSAGLPATPDWTRAIDSFGDHVLVIGDMTGDGTAELAVIDGDRIDLFLGDNAPLSAAPDHTWVLVANNPRPSAGDVNGDGLTDLLVVGTDSAVLYGGAAGLAAGPQSLEHHSDVWRNRSGIPAIVPDLTGDGLADVVVADAASDPLRIGVVPGTPAGIPADGAASAGVVWLAPLVEARTYADLTALVADVDLDGHRDLLVSVGSYSAGEHAEGAVFAFRGTGAGLQPGAAWSAESHLDNGYMVGRLVLDGDGDGADELWVGLESGAKRIYEASPEGLPGGMPAVVWRADPVAWPLPQPGGPYLPYPAALVGLGLAGADLDGDGFSDLVFGESSWLVRDGEVASQLLALPGGPGGLASAPSVVVPGLGPASAVASLGDLDADGLADVLVGQHRDMDEGRNDPACFLPHPYYGYSTYSTEGYDCPGYISGWSVVDGNSEVITTGDGFFFGANAASAGDVNGDGWADLLAFSARDEVALWYGRAGGFEATPAWRWAVPAWPMNVATPLAGIGDVDGDGFDDLAIGDPGGLTGTDEAGAVQIFLGSAAGPTLHLSIAGSSPRAGLGVHVVGAGDTNGDGFDDVLLSTLRDGAQLHLGSSAGLAPTPAWTVPAVDPSPHGYHAWPAGDVDGDGLDDVIVQPVDDLLGFDDQTFLLGLAQYQGEEPVRLFLGSAADGVQAAARWQMAPGWGTGHRARGVGDLDGDGLGDVALTGSLSVFVLYGAQLDAPIEYPLPETGTPVDTDTPADTGTPAGTGTPGDTGEAPGDDDDAPVGDDDAAPGDDEEAPTESGCGGCSTHSSTGGAWGVLVLVGLVFRRRQA